MKTHKEEVLAQLKKLPVEKGFEIPDGLLIPFGTNVLLKRVNQGAIMSPGGILIPESSGKEKMNHGFVVAIGEGVTYPVSLGMKVEFHKSLDEDTFHNAMPYLLIDQFNIKGAVPPGNYKHPKYPTNDEKRRASRIEDQSRAKKVFDKKHEELQG